MLSVFLWFFVLKESIKQHFGISISTSISIRKVINIYNESPYEMQTEMSRGPLAEDEHSKKEMVFMELGPGTVSTG